LSEFQRSLKSADKATKKKVRERLKKVGDIVREDAQGKFSAVDVRSASRYRVRVRARGISVEQSLRKTTGKHPTYGALQMRRALVPALEENVEKTVAELEAAMRDITEIVRGA
jgi:hypothetical protein